MRKQNVAARRHRAYERMTSKQMKRWSLRSREGATATYTDATFRTMAIYSPKAKMAGWFQTMKPRSGCVRWTPTMSNGPKFGRGKPPKLPVRLNAKPIKVAGELLDGLAPREAVPLCHLCE